MAHFNTKFDYDEYILVIKKKDASWQLTLTRTSYDPVLAADIHPDYPIIIALRYSR